MMFKRKKRPDVTVRLTTPNGQQSVVTVPANNDGSIDIRVNEDGSIRVEGGWTA